MTLSNILAEKKKYNSIIKKTYGIKQNVKPLGLIKISNKEELKELVKGLSVLPGAFIILCDSNIISDLSFIDSFRDKYNLGKDNLIFIDKINKDLYIGFDFILCDNSIEDLTFYTSKGITPIIIKDNYLSSILKEFDPVKKIDGNSFTYDVENSWAMFYAVVKYLENYKFPYDNRNLVKNVIAI